MSAVHNEQTKLPATALSNVAVAFAVVGFVTPLTAMSFGVASAPRLEPSTAAFAVVWLGTAIGLHWVARRVLRSLRT